MLIIYAFLFLCIFSCRASNEDIAQQAAVLFIMNGTVVDQGNPILQQATNVQPFLYAKAAKKIVLEALKFDPIMAPKNLKRVDYKPVFKGEGINLVQNNPVYARIETVWEKGKKDPKIFLFYKAPGHILFQGDAPVSYSMYSFNGKFFSSIDVLDMAIAPNGKYIASLERQGYIEIKSMDEKSKNPTLISMIEFSNVKSASRFTSGAIRWFNDGKHGYCVLETDLYKFSFDSLKTYTNYTGANDDNAERIGQFTKVDPKNIIIKDLSVESNTGESLYNNYCAIDYTQDSKETAFVYTTEARQPDMYTVKTNLGERSLLLSSPNTVAPLGSPIKLENLVTGYDVATARNLKNLESYDAVTVDEEHNVVYLFKNENQDKSGKLGFIPVIEWVHFVPDYIDDLGRDFNQSVAALSRVEAKSMTLDIVKTAVKDKLLLLKAGLKQAVDISSIDVDATAKDIVRKALAIYKNARDRNSLAVAPQSGSTQQNYIQRLHAASQQPAQPRGSYFQRFYNRAYTWYSSFSDVARSRMRWFAGVMAVGVGALGFTWLYKYKQGDVPTAYGKLFQQGQPNPQIIKP